MLIESRFFHRLLVLPLIAALLARSASAAEVPRAEPESVGLSAEKLKAVRANLDAAVQAKRIAGAVALVARKGKIADVEAVGLQDREAQKPMTPETIFRICSMTKPVTSVGIMMLVEEGKVRLEDTVLKYIPEFKDMKVAVPHEEGGAKRWDQVPAARDVTVRDLITHTSGLVYGMSGREYISDLYKKAGVSDGVIETKGTIEENVRKIARQPLLFQPGTAWEYGLNTDVLGRVIEVASGKTLEEFFDERIFRPLGMNDTYFRLPPEKAARLAAVYRPAADGTIERQPDGPVTNGPVVHSAGYPVWKESKYFSGGAGLVSTVSDYARFLIMLQQGGELSGTRILKKETVDQMTRNEIGTISPLIKNHGDVFGYGFGVVSEAAGDQGLGSPGTFSWGGFYYTYFWVDPSRELVGIFMAQMQPWGNLDLWNQFRHRVYEALKD